jgi:hypothetical protein
MGWWLSPTGLILDLIGVALLGFDLVRIQWRLRLQANRNRGRLESLIEEHSNVEDELRSLASEVAWHSYNWDEGQAVADYDSYNPDHILKLAAQTGSAVGLLREFVQKLSTFFIEMQEDSRQTADKSLRYSYMGLALVALGFVFQLLGTLPPIVT